MNMEADVDMTGTTNSECTKKLTCSERIRNLFFANKDSLIEILNDFFDERSKDILLKWMSLHNKPGNNLQVNRDIRWFLATAFYNTKIPPSEELLYECVKSNKSFYPLDD